MAIKTWIFDLDQSTAASAEMTPAGCRQPILWSAATERRRHHEVHKDPKGRFGTQRRNTFGSCGLERFCGSPLFVENCLNHK